MLGVAEDLPATTDQIPGNGPCVLGVAAIPSMQVYKLMFVFMHMPHCFSEPLVTLMSSTISKHDQPRISLSLPDCTWKLRVAS